MRKTITLAAAALLLGTAVASGQQMPSVPRTTGVSDFAVRFTDTTGDAARLQRYRDLEEGALLDQFRFTRQGEAWRFESSAEYVGRRDQRFSAAFIGGSKVKLSFIWDQMPAYMTANASSPYLAPSPGVLRLDPLIREGIQSGRLGVADLAATGTLRDVRAFRHVGTFDVRYNPTRQLGLNAKITQTRREGTMPWMAAFAFSDVVEVAAPIDTRNTDVDSGLEWSNPRGLIRVGYAGSWFQNDVQTLIWDNPLRNYDATASNAYSTGQGGSTGQAALWPNSSQQGVTGMGSVALPGRTRVTGSLTAGIWQQNQALLPITANVAIPEVALPRATAEAEARTLATNLGITSRPVSRLWLNARYRSYSFDNRTPVFHAEQFVVMDQTAHEGVPTHPLGYSRQNLDLDAAVTPFGSTAIRAGYSRADDERPTRIFRRTAEDTYRTSLDTTAFGLFTLRGIYEHSVRRGSEFDVESLIEAGEQPAMRHYDIADRNRDRVTALVQVTPHKTLGLTASVADGRDVYGASGFGLRDSDSRSYAVGAEVSFGTRIGGTATYTVDRFSALQNSRTASPGTPQVTDPTRDWALDSADRTETIGGSLDLLKLIPRLDIRTAYDRTTSRSTYLFRVPVNSTIAALKPLPPVTSALETGSADLRFYLTPHVAIGGSYWYDRYDVDDFAVNDAMLKGLALPGALYMGSLFRPSVVQTGSLRLIFIW